MSSRLSHRRWVPVGRRCGPYDQTTHTYDLKHINHGLRLTMSAPLDGEIADTTDDRATTAESGAAIVDGVADLDGQPSAPPARD